MGPAWGGPRGGGHARGTRRCRSGQYRHYRRQRLRRRKAPLACSGPRPARTVLLDGPVLERSELRRAHKRRARRGRGPGVQLRDRRGPVRVGGSGPAPSMRSIRSLKPLAAGRSARTDSPSTSSAPNDLSALFEGELPGVTAQAHVVTVIGNVATGIGRVGARGTEALRARRHAGSRRAPGESGRSGRTRPPARPR